MTYKSKLRLSVSLGIAQTLAWASSYYIPAVMARPIADGVGCPTASVYAAFSVALILAAITAPFVGRHIDHFGGKRVLAASSIWFALSLVFLSQAQEELSLFFSRGCIGLAMGADLYDMAFATVVRSYGPAASPIIAGITLIGGFASTVGWPISHFLLENIGWRYALLTWAGVHLFVTLPLNISLLLPENANGKEPERQGGEMEEKTKAGKVQAMVLLGTVYVDPPYWDCEHYYGRGIFSREDFTRLAAQLEGIKGRFMLSLNDTPGVREMFKAFAFEAVQTKYTCSNGKNVPTGEVLIRNW